MVRDLIKKRKAGIVFLGDIVVFFGSLALMLSLRYGRERYIGAFHAHLRPFALLLALWLLVFYIADLYAYTTWRTTYENGKRFAAALLVNFFLSISIFYLFSSFFKLTPKLNLVIFAVIFGVLDCAWRYVLARMLASKNRTDRVLVLATTPLAEDILAHARAYPELGYTIERHATTEGLRHSLATVKGRALIVVDTAFMKDKAAMATIYEKLAENLRIETFADFYGTVFGRLPLSEVTEERFIEETNAGQSLYDTEKRITDIMLSIFLIVLFSPLSILLYVAIGTTSKGSPIYRQTRVGKGGTHFTLYKFRSMRNDAEKDGPVWWKKDDDRTTKVGKVLRRTHLDELPQLWNILLGDMSFVGPRPERPEFLETLKAEIPHYLVRQTIKPGLTGWAQIKFRYASTVMDWKDKFEYDLYYVQNRSFLIDAGVIAKTVHFVFR